MKHPQEIGQYSRALTRGQLSRRQFLQRMGLAGVGIAMGSYVSLSGPGRAMATDDPSPLPAGVKITANYMKSGTYDKAAEDLKPKWETKTGNTIEIAAFPWTTLNQTNITDLTTQTGAYDLMSGEYWIASVFEHMLPLDDLAARDNIGLDYIPTLFGAGPSNFYNGKRVGIPYSADAYAVLYRPDLFEQAGIKPEWTTWDEFADVMEALQPKLPEGVSPHCFSFGAPEQPGNIFLGAYSGTLVTKDNKYAVERDKAVAALNTVMRLPKTGPSNVLALSIDEATAVFLQGKSATLIGWPSFIRASADNPAQSQVVGKWQLSPMPGPGFSMLSCWNLFISKYSKSPEVAWDWIKAYANAENGKYFMETYGIGSPFKTTYEDAELLKKHAHDYPAQLLNLGRTKSLPYTFEAYEVLFRHLGDMLSGAATAEEVVDRWQESWSKIEVPASLIEPAEKQGLKAM